ncbi:hypothetical protein DEM27_28725 [Metarhizobium album]|uniref:Uncharacterized protein n=1 Tax=Metarhizobium album TaxID=2182425 RepID=A0A2U2DHL1_9HYPH|nr:hypothetical protein [Rhizobium album]PWE52789.1 hypothetical protein DEM27_28725 [Rhizobium album]
MKPNGRGFWFLWGLLAGSLLAVFLGLGVAATVVDWNGKSSELETRLREWVSALGGWAAVAAAIPTVIFLAKENTDAGRRHRDLMKLSLRRERALAKRALALASKERQRADLIYNGSRIRAGDHEDVGVDKLVFIAQLEALHHAVSDRSFEWVETEIEAPEKITSNAISKSLNDRLAEYGAMDLKNRPIDYWPTITNYSGQVRAYMDWVIGAIAAYEKEADQMVE